MVTKDIYQRVLKPNATDAQVLKMSRIRLLFPASYAAWEAIFLVNASKVLDIVYSAYSLRGALFIVVLFGIYWKRASEKGSIWSMLFTGVAAVVWTVVRSLPGTTQ
jgi:SSS family solute:Na+ symporter